MEPLPAPPSLLTERPGFQLLLHLALLLGPAASRIGRALVVGAKVDDGRSGVVVAVARGLEHNNAVERFLVVCVLVAVVGVGVVGGVASAMRMLASAFLLRLLRHSASCLRPLVGSRRPGCLVLGKRGRGGALERSRSRGVAIRMSVFQAAAGNGSGGLVALCHLRFPFSAWGAPTRRGY